MANIDVLLNRLLRLLVPAVAFVAAGLAVVAVVDRLAQNNSAAERRALVSRGDRLTALALTPGSALACLDSGAGEAAETACEAAVFASPQSTAAAVAYVGARLRLLADAKALDPSGDSFAATRRAIELDRYGIAAHVLASRDLCTAERCGAFALLADTNALKSNMKAQAFDQYVSRYSAAWTAPVAAPAPASVSAAPPAEPANPVKSAAEPVAHPLSSKYTLPSAASIPAVSIMNAEPPLPKAAADALAAQSKAEARPDAQPDARPDNGVPMPPKRPQAQPD
ncbi:MAG: hypothetical protein PSV22_21435 [Pseudolabrys sp.]|nr:hypothetical protein [Pseudolabrys sp.]